MKYTKEQIIQAVHKEIISWDIDSLRDYAIEVMQHHYLYEAYRDEISRLMKDNKE